MLCYVILYSIILYSIILYHIIFDFILSYYIILCYVVLYYIKIYFNIILYIHTYIYIYDIYIEYGQESQRRCMANLNPGQMGYRNQRYQPKKRMQ